MEKNNCNENGHRYGLWKIENEHNVSRTCKECGYVEILPKSEEYDKEIAIQLEAESKVKKLLTIPNDDDNIIAFSYAVIDKFLSFIDDNLKLLLINKISAIQMVTSISEENKILLKNLKLAISNDNGELLDNTMSYLEVYNIEAIQFPILETSQSFSK